MWPRLLDDFLDLNILWCRVIEFPNTNHVSGTWLYRQRTISIRSFLGFYRATMVQTLRSFNFKCLLFLRSLVHYPSCTLQSNRARHSTCSAFPPRNGTCIFHFPAADYFRNIFLRILPLVFSAYDISHVRNHTFSRSNTKHLVNSEFWHYLWHLYLDNHDKGTLKSQSFK